MGLSSCCTNRDANDKNGIKSIGMTMVDLNNRQDLNKVIDEYERFKYLFPFYRMNIAVFDQKMQKITGIKAVSKETDIISLEEFAKEFKKTDAWLDGWQNVEKLWKTPEFKMIVVTERKAIQSKIPED